MRWFFGALVLLVAALFLQSGLLAYAMYVLLGVMVLSRWLARISIRDLSAKRRCKQTTAEVGDELSVAVTVTNAGPFPVPWVLLEDLLPKKAIDQKPPRLKLKGKRLTLSGGDLTEPVTFDLVGPPSARPDSIPVPPDPDTEAS